MMSPSLSTANGNMMSCLVGTGHNIWSGIYVVASTLGFILLFGILEVYYIKPFGVSAWWYRGLLFTLCMVAGVIFLGGIVVFFWNQWEKRSSCNEKWTVDGEQSKLGHRREPILHGEMSVTSLSSLQTTLYGCRPNFQGNEHSFLTLIRKDSQTST